MRFPSYLVRSNTGVFHFRFVVPASMRVATGKRVIKQSLHTRNKRQAQVIAQVLASRYSDIFALQGDSKMIDDNDILAVGIGSLYGKKSQPKEYEITMKGGQIAGLKVDDAADHLRAMQALEAMQNTNKMQVQNVPSAKPFKSITLGKAVEAWLASVKTGAKTKTFGQKKLAVEGFSKWKGERAIVYSLESEDFSKYATFLAEQRLAQATLSNRLMYCGQFMKWATSLKYYPRGENPAAGKAPYGKKKRAEITRKTGWQAFTDEQIKAIFSVENFKKVSTLAHTRWCLVMGLYTGARISELAQLGLKDFKKKNGNNYISIDTLEEGQSLKTADSRREIRIHPDLIKLGLLNRVEALTRQDEIMLFPKLKDGQNGFGGAVSKGITRYLELIKIKARGVGRVGAHSFRTTMIDYLDDCEIKTNHSRAFVGHSLVHVDAHEEYKQKRTRRPNDRMKRKGSAEEQILSVLPAAEWEIDLEALKPLLAKI